MQLDPVSLAAILAMAASTYFTRIFGYWLVRRTTVGGRMASALEAVPGAILTAIIAPMAFATGPAESGAALITVLLALRLPLIVAVAGGCLAVVALRALLA
ncbi:AzlD family protein [Pelagibius marinus]|uniref:AzlD family protein n=1 Tax=Pelagibius marinus TaxID=2762760 RepID=UPI001872D52D|nr:AzlD domain-containing protein [Pelagibius marinus]